MGRKGESFTYSYEYYLPSRRLGGGGAEPRGACLPASKFASRPGSQGEGGILLSNNSDEDKRGRASVQEKDIKNIPVAINKKYGQLAPALISAWLASRARILEQSMGARNQVGIGLSYRPARLGIDSWAT